MLSHPTEETAQVGVCEKKKLRKLMDASPLQPAWQEEEAADPNKIDVTVIHRIEETVQSDSSQQSCCFQDLNFRGNKREQF